MDRAYESNGAGAAPAPPNPPLLGYPSETGTPTKPGAWWFYMITEELRAVLVAGGIVPDATKVNQVAAAITALAQAAITAATINWNQIENVPSNTGAVANTMALRDGSAGLTAASFNVSSDERLKEDIKPIEEGALERIRLYRAVTYRRKGTGRIHAGFLAGDFAKSRPEGVHQDEDGFLAIDVMAVATDLHQALCEAEARIAALEARP